MDNCAKLREEKDQIDRRIKDLKDIYKQYEGRLYLKGWEKEDKSEIGRQLFKLNINAIHKLLEIEKCMEE